MRSLSGVLATCLALGACHNEALPSQRLQLRAKLEINLDTVSSFVVLPTAQQRGLPLLGASTWGLHAAALGSAGLHAVTFDGEVAPVSLVTNGQPSVSPDKEPLISAIWPTPKWIFLSTNNFQLDPEVDGGPRVPCPTIVARRSDGALYCMSVGIAHVEDNYGNLNPQAASLRSSATGDIVYLAVRDELSRLILYRFVAGVDGGPTATLVDPTLFPEAFFANASGDLLVQVRPLGAIPGVTKAKVLPLSGPPFDIAGERNTFVTIGDGGTASADAFYLINDEAPEPGFHGVRLRLIQKGPAGFVELPASVTMEMANCYGLFRVQGGHVMYCNVGGERVLARVLVDGAVVSAPTMSPLTGVIGEVISSGWAFRAGGGHFYLLATRADGPVLVRHDGVKQTDIPVDARIQVLGMSVLASGDLHLLGVYTDTNQRVRAVAKVGSSVLALLEVAGLKVAEALVFVPLK